MRNIVFNDGDVELDNGLLFGKGIFETILIKNEPILLEKHIMRANKSINLLKLGDIIKVEEIREFILKNNIKNKALKIVVTEKNIIYSIRDIKYKKEHYNTGFNVKFSNVFRNSSSPLTYIKSLNYLDNIMEYELAQDEGYNEAIFLNYDGYVTEGCTTNLFMIKNNNVITPSLASGILPGVIREWVIDNFYVEEKKITKEELLSADEIFLTNSLVGIIKVSKIENINFNSKYVEEIHNKYLSFINGGELQDE